jgi:L-aspartate oxidase
VNQKNDFLIIGSGIAGLTYALKLAYKFPDSSIAIVTKSDENESNTKYAQGGIAVVLDEILDSYEGHIEDTLIAGDGLCDEEVVRIVVTEGPERFKELVSWGAAFDKDGNGEYNLGLEGGHSKNRILHHKDITGFEIEQKLLQQIHTMPNVKIYPQHLAIDLITNHHIKKDDGERCYGAYILNTTNGKIGTFTAKITLLASGGIGQVYKNTTNPSIATGDGIAMAYRAYAKIQNMEFIQFHPTALFDLGDKPTFLISEAVRGFGAILRNQAGHAFMEQYHPQKDLAPRDIVSRAIDSELKKSGDNFVYLDCRHLDLVGFENHFPTILRRVQSDGIDISKDMIPVVPAAHYLCGGVVVDHDGQTSVPGLFACGECSQTGLHGANRLASNSLLEALVFAHRSYLKAGELMPNIIMPSNIPDWDDEGTVYPEELILITHNRSELQNLMSHYVGIIRTDERLDRTSKRLDLLYNETERLYKKTKLSSALIELRNLITTAYLIVSQSKERKENRGAFFKKN